MVLQKTDNTSRSFRWRYGLTLVAVALALFMSRLLFAHAKAAAAALDTSRGTSARADTRDTKPTTITPPISPGSLDTTFGLNGKVLLDVGGTSVESCATAVLAQPDGKLLITGEVGGRLVVQDGSISRNITSTMDFALVRLNLDGSLDASFGNGGQVTTDISSGDAAFAVARQTDGKIVLAGATNVNGSTPSDVALARYNPDGSLDGSFGVGGKVRTNFGFSDRAYGLALQMDQKLVVTGQIGGGFAAVRYNQDGSLDTTFGANGKVFVSSGSGYAVAIQLDQKIVIAGQSACDFAAARLNPDGSFDSSFGVNGKVTTDLGLNFCDEAFSLVIQPDGKIVLAGDLTTVQFGVVRYNPDGSLDTNFGNGGKVLTPFTRQAIATGIVLQPDGNLIAVGGEGPTFEPPNQPPAQWALARYNPDGSLNTIFGNGGLQTTSVSNSSIRSQGGTAMGAALQPDGRLLVAGSAFQSKGVFGVARYYTSDGAPVLLKIENSEQAIALDSVTQTAGPFSLISQHFLSTDRRTRIVLFAINVDLQANENPSAVTAQAEDSQHRIFALPVEFVGKVPGFSWLNQISVRLPDELANAGEIQVSISVRGVASNKALVNIN